MRGPEGAAVDRPTALKRTIGTACDRADGATTLGAPQRRAAHDVDGAGSLDAVAGELCRRASCAER